MKFSLIVVYLFSINSVVCLALSSCGITPIASRTDCGYKGITAQQCLAKGCCWAQQPMEDNSTPWCYYSSSSSPAGYEVISMSATKHGYKGILQAINTTITNGVYGSDIDKLAVEINYISEDVIQVKINDQEKSRWEIPDTVIKRGAGNIKGIFNQNYKFTYESKPFSFKITRNSDNAVIFDFQSSLIYKDQYIDFTISSDPNAKTFGLGESTRTNHALKTEDVYTLWAADIAAGVMNVNLYGSYPMYLQLLNGAAHGALLLNSNGMDVTLLKDSINYRVIGGIVDLLIFNGPSPKEVVQQYTSYIGYPAMMPYWSLGLHNCKWGYTSIQEVEEIVANYSAAGIPLDTQWVDIDHMQNYRDFTLDAVKFSPSEVSSFVNKLHENGQHFVPIVDPGIMPSDQYDAYVQGVAKDLFIKDQTGQYYFGQVWPGPTNFPDFLHPSAQDYWTGQLKSFHDMVAIDGVWVRDSIELNF